MSPATSDRTTENSPPRKPERAKLWPYVVVLVLLYLGSYAMLRLNGRLWVAEWSDRRGPRLDIVDHDAQATFGISTDTWRTRLFRPCISVEEWWRRP